MIWRIKALDIGMIRCLVMGLIRTPSGGRAFGKTEHNLGKGEQDGMVWTEASSLFSEHDGKGQFLSITQQ